jgi:hypothetical protein
MLNILGFLLLIIPFILIFSFENKIKTFLYVLVGQTLLWMIFSVFLQYISFFEYSVVIIIQMIICIFSILFFIFNKKFLKVPLNWFLLFSIFIIFVELWSLHNFYSGTINTINGAMEVKGFSYTYPYFSDEWIGASIVSNIIENNTLPLFNPLDRDTYFANPLFPFFSFISTIFLILNINPYTSYYLFSIVNTILISSFIYIFLRKNNISKTVSIFSILFIPLITNGSNLPVTWYFLPFNLSLVFFLISLISLSDKDKKLYFISIFISLIFYPPIIVFVLPILFYELFLMIKKRDFSYSNKNKSFFYIISFLLLILFVLFLAYILKNNLYKYLLRNNLDGGVVLYYFWYVLPIFSIPFAIVGLFNTYKNKIYQILIPIFTGLVFWILYFFTTKIFIIDHPRIVAIASILLILISGFGIEKVLSNFNNKKVIYLLFILYFLVNFIKYPNNYFWDDLQLRLKKDNNYSLIKPAPPINMYLSKDDLLLFDSFKEKTFLSIPWKGLVVGTITSNYPLDSKGSTITNSFLKYSYFMSLSCSEKNKMADKFKIDLVYSTSFNCDKFKLISSSTEGLYLYSYILNK